MCSKHLVEEFSGDPAESWYFVSSAGVNGFAKLSVVQPWCHKTHQKTYGPALFVLFTRASSGLSVAGLGQVGFVVAGSTGCGLENNGIGAIEGLKMQFVVILRQCFCCFGTCCSQSEWCPSLVC